MTGTSAPAPAAPGDASEPLDLGDLAVLAVLAALLVAAVVGLVWVLDRATARQQAEAPADIMMVTPVSFFNEDGTRDVEYDISYRYDVDGRSFAGVQTEHSSDHRHARKVCYAPDDPTDHSLVPVSFTCGDTLLFGR